VKDLRISQEELQKVVPRLQAASEVFRGAQKIVFHALIANQSCALKVLIPPGNAKEDFDVEIARARREVDILVHCDSPHVVKQGPLPLTRTRLAGRDLVYFTEAWIEGMDLQTYLATEGILTPTETVILGRHVARAVEALWKLTKIHRDIKPENIMRHVEESDVLYVVTDMGAAFDLQDISLSRAGFLPGTEMYFSPEQFEYTNKRHLDFRSDLFSLGVVMYEAVTGMHPFWKEGLRLHQLMANIVKWEPPPPSRFRAEVPPGLDSFILRLLQKRRDDRWSDFDEVYRNLQAVLTGSPS
jgi:serine/threonine protein kinase